MSFSISSALASAPLAAANSSSTSPAPQEVQQPTTAEDTVTLTEAQQVYELYNQGQTVPQIATALSLTVSVVNNYLGISSTS
jgi:DNA-binding NarL/FixJ family response regulator